MEDLAEHKVEVVENLVKGSGFEFDIDKQFSTIGLRYGFVMDTQVAWTSYTTEYKEAWIRIFKDSYAASSITKADEIEDALISVIEAAVAKEEAYFMRALDTGSLSQEWVSKVLSLLTPSQEKEEVKDIKEDSLLALAKTEKPIGKQRHFAMTRRNKQEVVITKVSKKYGTTRRSKA
jgi:hypothetical protein